jgi:hypothetical protein
MVHEKYKHFLTDDEAVAALTLTVLDTGYISLDHFFDVDTTKRFQEAAHDPNVRGKKGEGLKGSVVHEVGYGEELLKLSQRIYDARCAITGEKKVTLNLGQQLAGMPYKDGRAGVKNEQTAFHFDGAYINVLYPIVLPQDQSKGDGNLIMFPNFRRKYSPLMSKVIARFLRHSSLVRNWYGYTEVVYKVDTLYIFFGDLSFHGVEPISNGERVVVTINSHW